MPFLFAEANADPSGTAVLFLIIVIVGLVAFFSWLFESKPKGAVITHRSRTEVTPK